MLVASPLGLLDGVPLLRKQRGEKKKKTNKYSIEGIQFTVLGEARGGEDVFLPPAPAPSHPFVPPFDSPSQPPTRCCPFGEAFWTRAEVEKRFVFCFF